MPDKKKSQAGGDAPEKNKQVKIDPSPRPKGKGKDIKPPEPEAIPKTPSQIEREKVEHRALLRKQRFKRKWPEIKKPRIRTVPWQPPPPPEKTPRVMIPLPEIVITRNWIPPYKRRRRRRPRLQRIPLEEITQPLYEYAKMKKIWHNFGQVEKNKMVLQGHLACNSKRSPISGAQTACIAVVCRGLLDEKTAAELVKSDVNEVIVAGEHFYRQCMTALKCYKGKPQLQLNQLLTSFYLHDMKYTVKMDQIDKGLLAKHPDNTTAEPDLMSLMEKRIGTTYMMILSTGDKHFLIWGHPPPPESGSQVKTVCYMFDPHMLDQNGEPHKLFGAGAFLRYAGVSSFVMDFLVNYGKLDAAKKGSPKTVTLTNIEVVQKEPLLREPEYELNLKTLNIHCRDEWEAINRNVLLEKKLKEGKYPQGSLSAVSLATSKATSRKKVQDFYQKAPKETAPQFPVPPEKAPPGLTNDDIKQTRGEDFFLYCPRPDNHAFGRDDMIPRPQSETVLYSPIDIADKNFRSQYHQVNAHKWILRGTRHMASYRYQSFKTFTGVACCVSALMTLLRLRARAWNEDIVDETLDLGFNFYRESLAERGGPIRRLVLGELKENLNIRNKEYTHKERGIAVWGKLVSNDPKVLDLCKGIESFFKESDCGILQIPGELEVAIFNEGERFYVYHPWPADRHGYRVGLQGGGKACLLYFTQLSHLCEHFMESVKDLKRKPFSISDVMVSETGGALPEPVNNLKPVAPNRWAIKGRFHEDDERFPEEHRGKQSSPNSIAAIAYAHVLDPASWTANDVDECLVRGDTLYGKTMDYMDKMGITLEPSKAESEGADEEEVVSDGAGFLGPANVLNKFQLSDYESVETDVQENAYSGQLSKTSGSQSLRDSLRRLFKDHSHAVLTARGGATAIWKQDDSYYYFDPHGCDEKGISSDEPLAGACLVRMKGSVEDLANVIMGNLAPGADDMFNLSPVTVSISRINPALGAPETKLESKAFEWISKGTAAILMGPRGENTAIGKAAEKAGIGEEDMAGRTLALPAAAAFVAASAAVPPPHMHQDHMFNFIDTGKDYYMKHVKKTGKKEMTPEDLTEKFEMGVNTFSLELGEPIKLPLRLPDEPQGEGEEEEEGDEKELEGEYEEEVKEEKLKQIKDVLYKTWNDQMQPNSAYLLVGDYHQMGVWMSSGGKVVAFDPAPTLTKGLLTAQRVKKGDELRLQRIKDEMTGEGGGEEEEAEDEEAMGEGEEKPEPIPEFVPPESCPALMVFASPIEFIDKLTIQGRLDRKQCLAPYKLYPVTVTNQMTSSVPKDKPAAVGAGDEEAEGVTEDAEDVPLSDEAIGKYFTKIGKDMASVRGRLGQNDNFYMDPPNRDNQDVANSAMGIVADHIEPHIHWKGPLLDAIVQFGDRLHSRSVQHASRPPRLQPSELPPAFHVTNFDVNLEVESDVVTGDITAGEHGSVPSLARGITQFFESHSHGILCCRDYCVGIWKGSDDKSVCLWEPHSVGPTGVWAPGGAATLVVMASPKLLAETFKKSIDRIARPGPNKFPKDPSIKQTWVQVTESFREWILRLIRQFVPYISFSISAVNVTWDLSKVQRTGVPESAIPDEGYECKVLTAFVENAKGRSILRGSRPPDLAKFTREAVLQSACGAIVAACMAHIRKPHLWTRLTVDEVMAVACHLFTASIANLGYEFRPGDDVLLPLQVLKRFILGANYVRYDIDQVFTGKLEQKEPTETTLRSALEQFFEHHTHGILWSDPCAVAVWRVPTSPPYYMMEPHACGPTGLRTDAQDDGAACVLTFTSPKLMAFAYLQNVSPADRLKRHFILYSMSITVHPIKNLDVDPPLVKSAPGVTLVPATSKVGVDGYKRRALESDRKHPPGDVTCADAERAALQEDETDANVKGQRNSSGWLVLLDGSQFLSAHHSMCCKKFPHASRGNQALSCSIMAVAMSRVEDVCRWCSTTLDQILESGDQLYQDSYLHYRPQTKVLAIDQILRKFYTPGNCVCRVVVFVARQKGNVDSNLLEQLTAFFREERAGVFVACDGNFAVALFRTPRGFYMFDPDDRDRVGRAVAPPCRGRARACFSQYPTVKALAEKLRPNIPPVLKQGEDKEVKAPDTNVQTQGNEEQGEKKEEKEVRFEEPAMFAIYGVDVTALRRINQYEL